MSQNDFHPIVLYSEDVKSIYNALVFSGSNELALEIAKKSKRTKADKRYVAAVKLWDDGAFDIDDDPVVSRGEDGAYVLVWQWVNKNEIQRNHQP